MRHGKLLHINELLAKKALSATRAAINLTVVQFYKAHMKLFQWSV
jgi:hypothetical protein